MHRLLLAGSSLMVVLLSPAVTASGVALPKPSANESEPDAKQALRRWVDEGWDQFNKVVAGTVETEVTPVHYRMGTRSFKTNFHYGIFDTRTQFGYGGRLKVETSWSSLGGNLSMNVTAEPDNAAAYLLQYKRQF